MEEQADHGAEGQILDHWGVQESLRPTRSPWNLHLGPVRHH